MTESLPRIGWSIDEVAERLHVNHQTVRKLILSGDLKSFRVRRQYRVLDSALEEFVKDQIVKPETAPEESK